MGVQRITERIVADARRRADEIVAQADARSKELAGESSAREAERAEADRARGRAQAEQEAAQLVISARLRARDMILHTKQETIDRVFALALEHLDSLDEKTALKVLAQMVRERVVGGEEVVLSARDHQRAGKQLVEAVNRELAAKKRPRVKLSPEPGSINSGFILRSGRVEENHSFAGSIAALREDMESDIAKMLWGDSGTA